MHKDKYLVVLFFFIRMKWPELLDHPFWIQLIKEQGDAEDVEEEDEDGDKEENDVCGGVCSVNLRCVNVLFFLTLWSFSFAQTLCNSSFIAGGLFHFFDTSTDTQGRAASSLQDRQTIYLVAI